MSKEPAFGPGIIQIENVTLRCGILYNNTPVLYIKSCQKALGFDGKSPTWLHDFILHLSRFVQVDIDIIDDLNEPDTPEPSGEPAIAAELFIHICNIIVQANDLGFLYASELKYAKNAKIILEYFAANPPDNTIEFASGLVAFKTAARSSVVNHLTSQGHIYAKWAHSFPDNFFAGILRMKGWKWSGLRPQLTSLAQICMVLVFARLSKDQLDELAASKPKMRYQKGGKPSEYIMHGMIKPLIDDNLKLMESSNYNWDAFMNDIDHKMPILTPVASNQLNEVQPLSQAKLSFFHENLAKAVEAGKFR